MILRIAKCSRFQLQTVLLPAAAAAPRSSSSFKPDSDDRVPAGEEEYYWLPHQALSPASIAHKRAIGRIETAIDAVLLADAAIREHLVDQYGLNIHRVTVSNDRRKVFLLWDANPGMAKSCAEALEKNAFRLRNDLAKVLKSKHTPFLEFRHNHLPPLKAAVAETMELVEQEAAADAAAAAAAAVGNSTPEAASINAAIARLEAATQPRGP